MPLHLEYDITGLRGAEYNPRHIAEGDLARLAESIKKLGIVKPLIVRGDLLVAGHQRTRALRALGRNVAPVYVLPVATTTFDEVRFNQLHNGTDMDCGDERAAIEGGFPEAGRFHIAEPARITGNLRGAMAVVRASICDLILKYGPWGGVVATQSGKVIHAAQYALAAKLTRTPLTTFVIRDEDEALYRSFLDKTYGVFSYEHLRKDTFVQSMAQMYRLRNGAKRANKSALYEEMVIPYMGANKNARAVDFGAGQGDYAAAMRRQGFNFLDVELFRRVGAQRAIDLRAVRSMVVAMCDELKKTGPFDVVVCDSVLNSVDCVKAEDSVMATLNVLCRNGGRVFFSGRRKEMNDVYMRCTKVAESELRRYVECLDKDGFSAIFRDGHWFYQKYHTAQQARELAERFGFRVLDQKHTTTAFQVACEKVRDIPADQARAAIRYEFDLPVSASRRLGLADEVIEAMGVAYGTGV